MKTFDSLRNVSAYKGRHLPDSFIGNLYCFNLEMTPATILQNLCFFSGHPEIGPIDGIKHTLSFYYYFFNDTYPLQ